MQGMDKELFLGGEKGGVVERLEKSHYFVHGFIFVLVVKDILSLC
jgi:hypothetical protein